MEKIELSITTDEAKVLLEVLGRIIEEQEEIRKESTKKITSCFALYNMLQKSESKGD